MPRRVAGQGRVHGSGSALPWRMGKGLWLLNGPLRRVGLPCPTHDAGSKGRTGSESGLEGTGLGTTWGLSSALGHLRRGSRVRWHRWRDAGGAGAKSSTSFSKAATYMHTQPQEEVHSTAQQQATAPDDCSIESPHSQLSSATARHAASQQQQQQQCRQMQAQRPAPPRPQSTTDTVKKTGSAVEKS